MNYLELCQTTRMLLRGSNDKVSTQLTSLAGLEGLDYEIKSWIPMAWTAIQNDKEGWRFMRRSSSLVLNAGVREVDIKALITDLQRVVPMEAGDCSPYILVQLDSAGDQTQVYFTPYEEFRYSWIDRGNVAAGRPLRFTITPSGSIMLDPTPDAAYQLSFDYRIKPVTLVDEEQVPGMPAEYHEAIVWWAIRHYYCTTRTKLGELRQSAETEKARMMQKLYNEQLPTAYTTSSYA